ncbi:hypothetical protein M3Y99_00322800 [Aphelenchoides fujianensis]|nr:hypothetical protein M3Y99_00322800 [Aphelenchoides fujianensis]
MTFAGSSTVAAENQGDALREQVLAASAGAVLTSLLMTPADVVKIRMQSQVQKVAKGECFLFSNGLMDHLCTSCADSTPVSNKKCEWFNRPGHFNGTIDAVVKIVRHEGVRSLWSGLSPTIVSAIPATVFYYTVYDNLLVRFRRSIGDSWVAPTCAGVVARCTAVTVVSPLEMVRTKMQSQVVSYTDLMKFVKTSIRTEGYSSLWRGLAATFLRDIPFSAVYWTLYESMKQRALVQMKKQKTDFAISFVCGATSGTIASVLTHPFDVVKTHRQITLGEVRRSSKSSCRIGTVGTNKSTMKVMREIVRSEGFRGLFAGLTPRIAKVAPACATMIGSYEYLKNWLRRKKE